MFHFYLIHYFFSFSLILIAVRPAGISLAVLLEVNLYISSKYLLITLKLFYQLDYLVFPYNIQLLILKFREFSKFDHLPYLYPFDNG